MPDVISPVAHRHSRIKSILLNLIVLAFGLAIGILLLEVLLRVYNPFQSRIKGNRIVLLTNKQYHIKNDIIPALEPVVTVTRNSLGFRGADPPAGFDQYLSIITIGGSTTQCFFLSDDKTWTAKVGDYLRPAFQKLWVNNAGLDGHSTYGHLVLLEDIVQKLHPKVVLFLVGANDVGRNPEVEFDAENVKGHVAFSSPTAFLKSLSPYSEVAALLANFYRSMNAYKRGLLHQKIELKEQVHFTPSAAEEQAYQAEFASPEYLAGYERRITRLVEISQRAGILPVLITQPLLAGEGTDDVTGVDLTRVRVNPRANGRMWWECLERYNDITRRVGASKDIPVIDLARKLHKSSRNFYDYLHLTPAGAQAVGNLVAAELCPVLSSRFPAFKTAQGCE